MYAKTTKAMVLGLTVAALLGGAWPQAASAQSSLASSEAEAFLGTWNLLLQTGQGDLGMDVTISDMNGNVGAAVDMPDLGASQDVTDIMRSGDDLVLTYSMNAQGQMVPVAMTLTPAGDDMAVEVDFANGMFIATGTATPAD
jgi:hypothetical protein